MMIRYICMALACAATLQPAAPEKTPVLLELFTSLGCSSCPRADKLLAEVDRQQPIPGARLIVLSEHVNYWNTRDWSDPFSSSAFTDRQEAYDSRFGVEAYTPQLVIDGTSALPGGNWPKAVDAIQQVLRGARIAIHVTATRHEEKAQIDIAAGPSGAENKGVVLLALARNQIQSHVGGGENAGRDLSEVAVAYSIRTIGKIAAGSAFSKSISVSLPAKSRAGDVRAIAFIRRSDAMQIMGADQAVF